MSTSMNDYLFGPLGKNYCLYFYFIALFAFVFMVFMIGSGLIALFNAKKVDMKLIIGMMVGILYWFVLYLQSRLLYNMCYNTEGYGNNNTPSSKPADKK